MNIEKIELALIDLEEKIHDFDFIAGLTIVREEENTKEEVREHFLTTLEDLNEIEDEIKRVKQVIQSEIDAEERRSEENQDTDCMWAITNGYD